jgi:FHA domain
MSVQFRICPECGYLNAPAVLKCVHCDTNLETVTLGNHEAKPTTKPLESAGDDSLSETLFIDNLLNADEELNTGKSFVQGDLILVVQQGGKKYQIPRDQLEEVVLGRRHRETHYTPTVDLTDVEGHKYGVSRRHATLARRDNHLVLIDHGSDNGTYLNGKRLMPEQPRVVRDADMIRLGKLELLVSFEKN